MSDTAISSQAEASTRAPGQANNLFWFLLLASFGLLAYLCWGGLVDMELQWQRDEYSHGYMIPLVALYILWKQRFEVQAAAGQGSWSAVLLMLAALTVFFVGEISTVYEFVQYAFVLALFSLLLSFFGWRAMGATWVAFAYLIFLIPLPAFVYKMLSSELQLVSSFLGVAVIRLFDISVYLEGNVIDLGGYQLQVVEACSGLRYLFPLMSFGFLIAYLFKAPVWQKVLLFLSTIPITVLTNSFRIGVIGVTVEYWGIEMAEGFLHDFEGWVVFMGCLGVLLVEMWLLHACSKSTLKFWDRIDLDLPEGEVKLSDFSIGTKTQKAFIVCLLLLLTSVAIHTTLNARPAPALERKQLATFPLYLNGWIGQERTVTDEVLKSLKVTEYLKADYKGDVGKLPVNLWVAYYDSQRDGAGIHSPRTCIPGGGWEMTGLAEYEVPGVVHSSGSPLKVNRVLVRKGDIGQLVYYWFEQRGRNITNEYAAKWYILLDAINDNRTDGALVRVIVPVPDVNDLSESDATLTKYLQDFYPYLVDYIPGKEE